LKTLNILLVINMGLREDYGGEVQEKTTIITAANTNTQLFLVPWVPPAIKQGVLEMLVISNQQAVNEAIVKIWDQDITSSGTVPPARGAVATPLIPPINVPAGTQVWLGIGSCPNIKILAGLTAQSTQDTVTIYAQAVVY
jgi:hypothetical protein